MVKWFLKLFERPRIGDVYFYSRHGELESWEFEHSEVLVITDVGNNKVRGKRAFSLSQIKHTSEIRTYDKRDLKSDWIKNNKFKSKTDVFKDELNKILDDE